MCVCVCVCVCVTQDRRVSSHRRVVFLLGFIKAWGKQRVTGEQLGGEVLCTCFSNNYTGFQFFMM